MRSGRPVTVLAALAALALPACGSDGGPGTGPRPDVVASSRPPRAATPPPAASRPAIVAPITVPDRAGVSLTVAPVMLRRQGRLTALELVARNPDPARPANLADLLRGTGNRFDRAVLVDTASGRRYGVAVDARDDCLCTSFADGLVVDPGKTAVVSAYLQAPPAAVRVVSIEVPGVGIFSKVPLR